MSKKPIKVNLLRSATVDLNEYCYMTDKYDCLTVTQWTNGEGFDVDIYREKSGEKRIQFTWGEFDAINAIIKQMNKT